MILEYMPYGDLQSFLTKHKSVVLIVVVVSCILCMVRPKQGEQTIIGLYHQIRFAGDVSSGLKLIMTLSYY